MSGRISDRTIERIRDAVDVVEVIGSVVTLKRSGKRFVGLCPFHEEKSPSFSVDPEQRLFYCFGCRKGGTVFTFVQERERLSFPDAVRVLAERAGIEVERTDGKASAGDSAYQACGWAASRYAAWLADDAAGRAVRAYLASRGLTPGIAERFLLGATPPERDGLVQAGMQAGWTVPQMVEAGLCRPAEGGMPARDVFLRRALFPVRDPQGRVCGFGARVLPGAPPDAPKYVNTAETPVFSKGRLLYGLWEAREAIRARGEALVVEGYADVLMLHQAGFDWAVGVLGTALTESHARLLKRQAERVVLLFDGDAAGRRATFRAAAPLLQAGLAVRVCALPQGDPDEYIRREGAPGLERFLATAEDLLRFRVGLARRDGALSSVEGRAAVADEVLSWVGAIRDSVRQDLWVREVAELLSISVGALQDRLSGVREGRPRPVAPPAAPGPAASPVGKGADDLIRLLAADPARAARVREVLAGMSDRPALLWQFCEWAVAGGARVEAFGEQLQDPALASDWARAGLVALPDPSVWDRWEQDCVRDLQRVARRGAADRLSARLRQAGGDPEAEARELRALQGELLGTSGVQKGERT